MFRFFISRVLSASRLVSLGTILACLLLPTSIVRAQRSIPDDNLAYPVLIQFPDEQASGFYISTDTSLYLVTAKHVLFDPATGNLHTGPMILLSYPHDPKEPGTNVLKVDTAALFQAGEIKGHPVADVAVVRIAVFLTSPPGNGSAGTIRVIPGVTILAVTASGVTGAGVDAIKKYEDVLVANDVLLFGYPTSLGLQESPQLDPKKPLLRRGIVAGLNGDAKSIIIDCPVYPGNSGGPVVEIDRSTFGAKISIIGVVSQFVPFEEKSLNYPISYQSVSLSNSGYSIVTPMDFVLELVK